MQDFLFTAEIQFGYKTNSGCRDALSVLCIYKTVKTKNLSTLSQKSATICRRKVRRSPNFAVVSPFSATSHFCATLTTLNIVSTSFVHPCGLVLMCMNFELRSVNRPSAYIRLLSDDDDDDSPTVALFCDSLTFLRQESGQGLLNIACLDMSEAF